jgi:phage-related minor tail protein
LNNTHPALDAMASKAQMVADSTEKISKVAGGLAVGMVGMAYAAGTAADDLNTLSKQTGFSTDQLQKFQYAADRVDVSMDDITSAAARQKKGLESNVETYDQLGISIYDMDGKLRNEQDIFFETIEALSGIENETERDTVAMALFGKGADSLAGIIDDGGAALNAFGEEAEEAGLILSQDALDGANAFNDGVDELKAKASAAFMEAGASLAENLLPVLEDLINVVSEVLTWIASLDGETLKIILTVLALVAAISPVASIIAGISTAVGALSATFTFLLSPIGLVIAAIAAAIAVGVLIWQNWETISQKAKEIWNGIMTTIQGVIDKIKGFFQGLWDKATEVWNGIVETVGGAIQKVKDFLTFKWEWPKIPLPEFKITGSANPLDWITQGVPHLDVVWHAKAMHNPYLLDGATIFGMQNGKLLGGGEAGQEVIMSKAMMDRMTGPTINITVNPAQGMDEVAVANAVALKLDRWLGGRV